MTEQTTNSPDNNPGEIQRMLEYCGYLDPPVAALLNRRLPNNVERVFVESDQDSKRIGIRFGISGAACEVAVDSAIAKRVLDKLERNFNVSWAFLSTQGADFLELRTQVSDQRIRASATNLAAVASLLYRAFACGDAPDFLSLESAGLPKLASLDPSKTLNPVSESTMLFKDKLLDGIPFEGEVRPGLARSFVTDTAAGIRLLRAELPSGEARAYALAELFEVSLRETEDAVSNSVFELTKEIDPSNRQRDEQVLINGINAIFHDRRELRRSLKDGVDSEYPRIEDFISYMPSISPQRESQVRHPFLDQSNHQIIVRIPIDRAIPLKGTQYEAALISDAEDHALTATLFEDIDQSDPSKQVQYWLISAELFAQDAASALTPKDIGQKIGKLLHYLSKNSDRLSGLEIDRND